MGQYITYSFYLGYFDRLLADQSNKDEIISVAIWTLNNLLNTLNLDLPYEINVGNIVPVRAQRFLAECSGAYLRFSIVLPVSICEEYPTTIGDYNYDYDEDYNIN